MVKSAFKDRGGIVSTSPMQYSDLGQTIAHLPPVKPDYMRVFRGQNKNYGTLVPSALRKPGTVEYELWRVYSTLIARSVYSESLELKMNEVSIEEYLIWTRAVAQHYGPGSSFLDVTSSVDVALWFALHEARRVRMIGVLGEQGPLEPDRDFIYNSELIHHAPIQTGFLYVLDVPCYSGGLEHGTVIDLSDAPDVFRSPRILAQCGLVVWANEIQSHGDLAGFQACEPIPVQRSGDDPALLNAPTHEVFPPPHADVWYKKLLSVPWRPVAYEGKGSRILVPTIPLTVYQYEDDSLNIDVIKRIITLDRMEVEPIPLTRQGEGDYDGVNRIIHIVCEAPLFVMLPPAEEWNENLLTSSAVFDAVPLSWNLQSMHDRLSFDGIMVQLSPLETSGWDGIQAEHELRAICAIQVVRTEGHYQLTVFDSRFPDGQVDWIRMNVGSEGGRFYIAGNNRLPLSGFPKFRKALYLALYILRELNTSATVTPFPIAVADDTNYLAELRRGNAVLVEASDRRDHFVLREALDPEQTFGNFILRDDRLYANFQTNVPWNSLRLEFFVGLRSSEQAPTQVDE